MTKVLLSLITPTLDKSAKEWVSAFSETFPFPALLFAPWKEKAPDLPKSITPALLLPTIEKKEEKIALEKAKRLFLESFSSPPLLHHSFCFQLTRRMCRAFKKEGILLDHSIFYPVSPYKPTHNLPLPLHETLLLPKSYGHLFSALFPPLLPFTHKRRTPLLPTSCGILPFYFTPSGFQEALQTFSALPILTIPIYLPMLLSLPQKLQKRCWARFHYLEREEIEWATLRELQTLERRANNSDLQNSVPLLLKGIDYPLLLSLYLNSRKQLSSHEAIAYL